MSRQPPVVRVGDYHVLDFVGAGGMGEVFRAVHERSGQVAAVKFLTGGVDLPPEARARWRNRFINEARVQDSLRHPNLAAFYEWHEVGSTPCIVMELVDGYTLNERLQRGAIPCAEALAIFKQVVAGVAFMHSQGVIHRDIKSSNIKINGRGEIKLLDFGIAKTNDMARLTATGAFVGTLQYLSPEQVKGKEADARCDVWALGALFYEMLSGSPPFEAPTWGELVEKVTRAHFEPLSTRCSNLPRELDSVVRRCLQKQPAARYANGSELLAALNNLDNKRAAVVGNSSGAEAKTTSYIPFLAAGGVGAVLFFTWFLWPASPTANGITPSEPTPPPVANIAVVTVPTTEASNAPVDQPLNGNSTDSTLKTITIDVFEGASQTQVYRGDQLLGNPPCKISGHIGEQIEFRLERPGFATKHESISITEGRTNYSFVLEHS
ncbi:serine/threonine protein kinase [bacterium]|nr:MAG: serine/threonine protein kinase [bacterium]